MATHTDKQRQAGDEKSSAYTQDSKPKAQRVHIVRGVPHRVLRSHFDPQAQCVIDVVEHKKIVKNRKGDDVEVVLERHMRCADEEIQKKFSQGRMNLIPIEVSDNG